MLGTGGPATGGARSHPRANSFRVDDKRVFFDKLQRGEKATKTAKIYISKRFI